MTAVTHNYGSLLELNSVTHSGSFGKCGRLSQPSQTILHPPKRDAWSWQDLTSAVYWSDNYHGTFTKFTGDGSAQDAAELNAVQCFKVDCNVTISSDVNKVKERTTKLDTSDLVVGVCNCQVWIEFMFLLFLLCTRQRCRLFSCVRHLHTKPSD